MDSNFQIWPPYEAFYIEAMLFSTKTALNAFELVNESLSRSVDWELKPELASRDRELILDGVQTVANCGAALSRYFWPSSRIQLHVSRAELLRTSLDVTDESPLKDRELRNMIEHFDERLDRYLKQGVVGHVVPSVIASRPSKPEVPLHVFRAYYTEVAVFEMLGHRFEIQPVVREVGRIHAKLRQCVSQGSMLPR